MKIKHIEVVPYNSDWPQMFESEAAKIKELLSVNCIAVYHVGSTSVPGLAAKPIIDIMGAFNNLKACVLNIETLGYVHKGEYNIPMRHYFSKKEGSLQVHLHAYEDINSPEIDLNMRFRNYLRDNADVRHAYEELKNNLLNDPQSFVVHANAFSGYNFGKHDYITAIVKKAGFDRLRLLYCMHPKEWEAYHRIRNEQLSINPDMPLNLTHKHFIMYKGIDIVAVAEVEFLNDSQALIQSVASDAVYKDQGYEDAIVAMIKEWLNYYGKSLSEI